MLFRSSEGGRRTTQGRSRIYKAPLLGGVGGGSKKAVDCKEENVEEVEEVEEVEKVEDKTLRKSADFHLRNSARKKRHTTHVTWLLALDFRPPSSLAVACRS